MNILNRNLKILCVVFILCLCVNLLIAETVILNDGTTYKGSIPHQDDNVVFIIQGEDLIKVKKQDVKEIKADEKANKDVIQSLDLYEEDNNAIEKNYEFVIKAGYDWNGDYNVNDERLSAPNGVCINAEFYRYIQNIVGVGLGVGGCNPREAKFVKGEFMTIPVYLSVKLRSQPTHPYKYGYVVGQVGYNFFNADNTLKEYGDMEGNLYYGGGFGFVINHVVFELIYSFNNGKVGNDDKFDFQYAKYTASIGYAF